MGIKKGDMDNGRNKWVYITLLLLVLVAYPLWKVYLSVLPQNYSIGKVLETNVPTRAYTAVRFLYTVNGKEFQGDRALDRFKTKPMVGDLFIVAFPERFNGKYGEILPEYRIIDEVFEIPPEGWDEIPRELLR